MRSSNPPSSASVRRDGAALVFAGALVREGVAGLWSQALDQLAGTDRFDLRGVERVDSAGLALLAELAGRTDGAVIEGAPAGLAELRTAYRLDPALGFAT